LYILKIKLYVKLLLLLLLLLGHQVSGHVDCTARVIEITKSKNNCEMFFELTEDSVNKFQTLKFI
jgi:riboflavin synthase alpha subunit